MIQFADEVARLVLVTRRYKNDQTGSEYQWDLYEKRAEARLLRGSQRRLSQNIKTINRYGFVMTY